MRNWRDWKKLLFMLLFVVVVVVVVAAVVFDWLVLFCWVALIITVLFT